jgi:hypothetical protein
MDWAAARDSLMKHTPDEKLRDHFLGWQCRIRQIAMRQDEGRPSSGMRPKVFTRDGQELSSGVIVVLVPRDPEQSTTFFRFQAQRTHDPRQTYEKGLEYLQATHFQHPKSFSDEITALFVPKSALADRLLEAGECLLAFEQFSQSYRMFCKVRALDPQEPAFEATFWHNRLFNPNLPGEVAILGFQPDWHSAQADPAP